MSSPQGSKEGIELATGAAAGAAGVGAELTFTPRSPRRSTRLLEFITGAGAGVAAAGVISPSPRRSSSALCCAVLTAGAELAAFLPAAGSLFSE